jgi:hypothetical protein
MMDGVRSGTVGGAKLNFRHVDRYMATYNIADSERASNKSQNCRKHQTVILLHSDGSGFICMHSEESNRTVIRTGPNKIDSAVLYPEVKHS